MSEKMSAQVDAERWMLLVSLPDAVMMPCLQDSLLLILNPRGSRGGSIRTPFSLLVLTLPIPSCLQSALASSALPRSHQRWWLGKEFWSGPSQRIGTGIKLWLTTVTLWPFWVLLIQEAKTGFAFLTVLSFKKKIIKGVNYMKWIL